jgi:hypothetical protein
MVTGTMALILDVISSSVEFGEGLAVGAGEDVGTADGLETAVTTPASDVPVQAARSREAITPANK